MKKLLSLGTVATIVAPVTIVVACSTDPGTTPDSGTIDATINLGDNTAITTKNGALTEVKITAAKETDTAKIIAATFIPGANHEIGGNIIDAVKEMDADEIKKYIKITGVTNNIDDAGKSVIARALKSSLQPATNTPVAEDINSSKTEAELKAILATAVTTIDTANSELGIMIPALVGSDFKSITWDNSALTLTLVTTVTGTQTDTTTIYTVTPTVMHNLDGTTVVFINDNKITKIKITANTGDSAEAIAAKYIRFSNSDKNEWTTLLKEMDVISLAKLLEITGPTTPINDDGKLTIANSLITLVTTIEDGEYVLNATTNVTVANHIFSDIHITVATTFSNTIAQNYQPGAYVKTEIAPLLKHLTIMEISNIMTYTFVGYPSNKLSGSQETIASAILASVNPVAK